jgi:hypothetical protein
MQEYYRTRISQLAESHSDRKGTDKLQQLFIQLSMAANIDYTIHYNKHQLRVNDFWSCILGDQATNRLHTVIKEFLASFIGTKHCDTLPAPC